MITSEGPGAESSRLDGSSDQNPDRDVVDPAQSDGDSEHGRGRDRYRDWSADFGRGLGYITRSVVDGLGFLWQTVESEVVSRSGRARAARSVPAQREGDLEDLLQRLGSLIAAHGPGRYDSLARNDELALLVRELQPILDRERRARRLQDVLARRAASQSRRGGQAEGAAAGRPTAPAPSVGELAGIEETFFEHGELDGEQSGGEISDASLLGMLPDLGEEAAPDREESAEPRAAGADDATDRGVGDGDGDGDGEAK